MERAKGKRWEFSSTCIVSMQCPLGVNPTPVTYIQYPLRNKCCILTGSTMVQRYDFHSEKQVWMPFIISGVLIIFARVYKFVLTSEIMRIPQRSEFFYELTQGAVGREPRKRNFIERIPSPFGVMDRLAGNHR